MAALALVAGLGLLTVLTFERVLAGQRTTLDDALHRQRDHLSNELTALLRSPRTGAPTGADRLAAAASEFVAVEPFTSAYVTVIEVGDRRFVTATSDPELEQVARSGGFDAAPVGALATFHTDAGDHRVLAAQILKAGAPVGRAVVAGPLEPGRDDALGAVARLLVAAGLSLGVGVVVMWIAMGRVLRPLLQLTDAAARTHAGRPGAPVRIDGDDEVADLAAEFNDMVERLDRAAADREQLLATISHELRTPLAVAQGHLELADLQFDSDPSASRHSVAVARAELVRTSRLVSDLLALGRSRHAGFLRPRAVALSSLVREIELRVDGLGLDTVTVAPAPPGSVVVDEDRLLQAVLNCAVNAVQHNPPGTTVDVEILLESATSGPPMLVIRMTDDGTGVDPELADRLLEPFTTAPSAGDPAQSTGLGLAVVDAVCRAHAGDVQMRSSDAGTVVELRIPATGPPAVDTAT